MLLTTFYGITRRGFGVSSVPSPSVASNYAADRPGDDVLAVLDALKINKPVLVGHSIGSEELSSVGSLHPERVAGLIYLDAGNLPRDPKPLIRELLETSLPAFEKDLRELQKNLQAPPPQAGPPLPPAPPPPIPNRGVGDHCRPTKVHRHPGTCILAIFAVPHDPPPQIGNDPAARAAFEARDEISTGAQAKAFESGLPSARVVRLPHANHYVFQSNEADVLREMNAFIGALP